MDFSLSEENRMIQDVVRGWTAKTCPREQVLDWDAQDGPPETKLAELAELGFCGMTIDEQYGGHGYNLIGASIVIEELAGMSPPLALRYASVALTGGAPLSMLGSPDQKQKYLPTLAEGLMTIALAVDEPGKASMPAAEEAGQLNGRVENVLKAHLYLTGAGSADSWSFFLVDSGPQASVQPDENLGLHGITSGHLELTGAPAGPETILGGPDKHGRGAEDWPVLSGLVSLATASVAVGLAKGALAYALDYVKERIQFNQPIGKFPAVREKLTELELQAEAAGLLCREAAWLAQEGRSFYRQAYMAQVLAVRAAKAAGLDSLHVLGGYGYAMEYDAQRYLRDALCLAAFNASEETVSARLGAGIGL
jgi:alkylation response protein AidB-like acyl-CoA dehydrogenase